MLDLAWPDWVGVAIAVYGAGAGAIRGFMDQSSRFLLLVAALAISSLADPLAGWLARALELEPETTPQAEPLILVGAFVLVLLVLTGARSFLFGPRTAPLVLLSRFAGALVGLAGSVLLYAVLLCGVSWTAGSESVQDLRGFPVARRVVLVLDQSPSPPRPAFLSSDRFPLPEPAPPRPGSRR